MAHVQFHSVVWLHPERGNDECIIFSTSTSFILPQDISISICLSWLGSADVAGRLAGWLEGSVNNDRYNAFFLDQHSVLIDMPMNLLIFTYCPGVLGMMNGLAAEQAGPANIVAHDQRQALVWIRERIVSFGGDTSHITS